MEAQVQVDCCGICLGDFSEKVEDGKEEMMIVRTPQCSHYYHEECILSWIDSQVEKGENPNCPICRKCFKDK